VSSFKEPQPLTPDEEALRRDYLQGLWEQFYITGDLEKLAAILSAGPEREVWDQEGRPQILWKDFVRTGNRLQLAEFIIAGGEIDKYERRKTIAEVVAAKPHINPGGSKDAINLTFYVEVELRMLALRPESSGEKVENLTLREQLASLKEVTKRTAIKKIASEETAKGRGVDYEAGRTRYKKGRKLFIEKFGREWN
jgi:hypothetical protein